MKTILLVFLFVVVAALSQPLPYYSNYNSYYGGYYQPYSYSQPIYGSPYGIYPGYGGWMNPMGTGSGWAAGGGLVGNTLSFLIG